MNEFFIKKTSTQPLLTMKVNKDNSVSYQKFNDMIQNSAISFSMKNIETNTYRILNSEGGIILKDKLNIDNPDEFYVFYKFKARDVRKPGKYIGEFKIDFFNTPDKEVFTGTFISPIHEQLYIIIEDSLLHSEDIYDSETVEIDTTDEYTAESDTIEGLSGLTTSFEYYKSKDTSSPLYLDEELTSPLNGYVKYLDSGTIIKYYQGYPIEMIILPPVLNNGFNYSIPLPLS